MFDLYLESLYGTFWSWCGTLIWNFYAEPLRGTFMWSFYPGPSWQTFLQNVYYVEPLCGTSGTWIILWNLYLWNLGICKSETLFATLGNLNPGCFQEWNLYVEPWGTWTFKSGTCMWNLVAPGSRFRASAPNHPEALLEEPQAFQAVGEKRLPAPKAFSRAAAKRPRKSR